MTEIEKLVERLRATARSGRVQDWRSDRDNDAWEAAGQIERLLAALKGAEGERDGLYREVTNLQWAARNCEDRVREAEIEKDAVLAAALHEFGPAKLNTMLARMPEARKYIEDIRARAALASNSGGVA